MVFKKYGRKSNPMCQLNNNGKISKGSSENEQLPVLQHILAPPSVVRGTIPIGGSSFRIPKIGSAGTLSVSDTASSVAKSSGPGAAVGQKRIAPSLPSSHTPVRPGAKRLSTRSLPAVGKIKLTTSVNVGLQHGGHFAKQSVRNKRIAPKSQISVPNADVQVRIPKIGSAGTQSVSDIARSVANLSEPGAAVGQKRIAPSLQSSHTPVRPGAKRLPTPSLHAVGKSKLTTSVNVGLQHGGLLAKQSVRNKKMALKSETRVPNADVEIRRSKFGSAGHLRVSDTASIMAKSSGSGAAVGQKWIAPSLQSSHTPVRPGAKQLSTPFLPAVGQSKLTTSVNVGLQHGGQLAKQSVRNKGIVPKSENSGSNADAGGKRKKRGSCTRRCFGADVSNNNVPSTNSFTTPGRKAEIPVGQRTGSSIKLPKSCHLSTSTVIRSSGGNQNNFKRPDPPIVDDSQGEGADVSHDDLMSPPSEKRRRTLDDGDCDDAQHDVDVNNVIIIERLTSALSTPVSSRCMNDTIHTGSSDVEESVSEDDSTSITPRNSAAFRFQSVSMKPLTATQATSLATVSQRNKRRKKRLSDSWQKKRKRLVDKEVYTNCNEAIKKRRKERYDRSPAFVQRLVDRVHEHSLYVNARGYRSRAKVNNPLSIKRKYSQFSPFRRAIKEASRGRYCATRHSEALKNVNRSCSRRYHLKNRNRRFLVQKTMYRNSSMLQASRKQRYLAAKEANAKTDLVRGHLKRLSPLIKRKYMRIQRQGAPFLPPLNFKSAEARANRFRNWKRFKVNLLLARMGISEESKVLFRRKKYEITQLLHQVLNVQRKTRKLFYEGCSKLSTIYQHAADEISGITDDQKIIDLKKVYGGAQYHIPSMEAFGFDTSTVVYRSYNEVMKENEEDCHPNFLNLKVRLCDDTCLTTVSERWPIVLHDRLALINKNLQLPRLLANVADLEHCSTCNVASDIVCQAFGDCSDMLRMLIALKPHYVGIRTLLRDVYRGRNSALKLHIMELLLLDGRYADFIAFRNEYCSSNAAENNAPVDVKRAQELSNDDKILQRYGDLKAHFDEAVEASMEIYECTCCLRLVQCSKIKTFKPSDSFLKRQDIQSLRRAYEEHFGIKMIGEVSLCHSCHGYFKNKKVSPFSNRNFMWPSNVPDQILRLNPYERQLISLAKSFQCIVKLKPHTYYGPSQTLTRAIKGLSVQIPLPLGTISNVKDIIAKKGLQMPNCSNFLIEVDSMPSLSKKNVFRSLVDMSNVVESLQWLKENNSLYQNIIIDRSFILLDDDDHGHKLPMILRSASGQGAVSEANDTQLEQENELESTIQPSKRQMKCRATSYFETNVSNPDDRDNICPGASSSQIQPSYSNEISDSQRQSIGNRSVICGHTNFASGEPGISRVSNVQPSPCREIVLNKMSAGTTDGGAEPSSAKTSQAAVSRRRLNFCGKISSTNLKLTSVSLDQKIKKSTASDVLQSTVSGGDKDGVMPGGSEAVSFVKAQNFPVNYAVPYKKFLPAQLANSSSMVMHVPEDELLEEFSIINMEHALPKVADLELFALKPIKESPLAIDDPLIDVACYPHLYPYGQYGLYHKRLLYVSPAAFFQHRLRLSTGRYRRDIPYLFDSTLRNDRAQLNSSMYTMLNYGSFGNVTVGQLRKGAAAPQSSPSLEKNVATLLRQVVGSPQYWLTVRLDLEAFIEEYGSATFFLTVSCAEYKLTDFKRFLEIRNTDLPNVKKTSIRNLVSIDPVSVSLHFHNRFDAFWDQVIMAENGPLGKVEHYYMRVEYQQRGAPHMHVLLWVSGAPVHGRSEEQNLLDFITDHVSCTLPDPVKSPELHRLVTQFQMHRCSNSCRRKKMVKGKCYCVYCRYGFPRAVSNVAKLNTAEAVMEARTRGKGKLKLYDLPRTINEIMINDYNPAILMIWGCNIDIQFIQDDKDCLVYYTTKYVCKSEKQQMSEIAATINKDLSEAGMAQSFALKLLSSRQLGANEAADRVLRHPIYKLSSVVKRAGFYYPDNMKRRLKPKSILDKLPEESTDVFCNNFQTCYYPHRPKALELLSAYEVMRLYDYRYGVPPKNQDLYLPKYGITFFKRRHAAVVRLWKPRGDNSDDFERYCFQVVALFKPFRSAEELLRSPDGSVFSTYRESYQAFRDQLPQLQRHEAAKDRLGAMIEWAEEIERRVNKSLEKEVESGDAVFDKDAVTNLDTELAAHSKILRETLSREIVEANMKKLNQGQRVVFDSLVDMINQRFSNSSCGSDDTAAQGQPKRIFVSGVGGTGKSFLITVLTQYLEFHYSKEGQPAVLVAAPTGVAAVNIDGVTVHKLLKLPVSKGSDSSKLLFPLHVAESKTLRHLFANVKLLIIDEVSMLSNLYLLIIHKRLNEILVDEERDPFARFGNLNILLLGDLLQLPPVNAPHIFKTPTRKQIENAFQSLGYNINLWRLFEFKELTENMRQRDDLVYARMLDRIRIGSPTKEDLEMLRQRIIPRNGDIDDADDASLIRLAVGRFLLLLDEDPYALCILPLNDLVTQFNKCVMDLKNLTLVTLKALDTVDGSQGGRSLPKKKQDAEQQMKRYKRKLLTTAETGGLEENLVLAEGARVMLRRNLDVTAKLVNGSIGYIEEICRSADVCSDRILVRFQAVDKTVVITRVKSKYYVSGNLYIERCQFPLILAYAVTVHKSQGLSLKSAVLDLGDRTFSAGMAYVALSRVTNLSQVHLIRLAGKKIICADACVKEYNRLRSQNPGDELIHGWNQNPEYDSKEKVVRVSSKEQAQMLREETQLQASIKSITVSAPSRAAAKKKKKRQISSVEMFQPGMYLKLTSGDGHSCFANASIQYFLRCHDLYPSLQQHGGSSAVSQNLLLYFNAHSINERSPMSADVLRQAFGRASQYSSRSAVNCDPAELMEDVLRQLPYSVSSLFMYSKKYLGTCPRPGCHRTAYIRDDGEQYLERGVISSLDHYTFKDVFSGDTTLGHRCHFCQEVIQQFPVTAEYLFQHCNRFLILNNPVMYGADLVSRPLTGLIERGLQVFGHRWRFVACIQMNSSLQSLSADSAEDDGQAFQDDHNRHYTAYIRHDGSQWIHLNDTAQHMLKRRPLLRNMVILVLERILQ